jgi:hypothetical protein
VIWLAWAYQTLASPECNGCIQCAEKCAGAVLMWEEEAEAVRVAARARGVTFRTDARPDEWQPCPFLDKSSRLCKVYAVRPLVCRLFGRVEWLPCPSGRAPVLPRPLVEAILAGYRSRPRKTLAEWQSRQYETSC